MASCSRTRVALLGTLLLAALTSLGSAGCIVPRGGPSTLEDETEHQPVVLTPGAAISADFIVRPSTGAHSMTGNVEIATADAQVGNGVLTVSISGPNGRSDSATWDASSDPGPREEPVVVPVWLQYAQCPDASEPCAASYRLDASWQGEAPLNATVWALASIGGAEGASVAVELVP
jgi:hypothetical protein